MLIIRHADVAGILAHRELEVIDLVRDAYLLHEKGQSSVPHSTFLRFPGDERNRIIGLPAYLGGENPAAGMKWIASFPGNLGLGLERASAAILLSSVRTGRPEALIEGSLISAKRTAASAALAARMLIGDQRPVGVTLIGCGVINLEVLRFLRVTLPTLAEVTLFDRDRERAGAFRGRCAEVAPDAVVSFARSSGQALAAHGLVSVATTAPRPHTDLSACRPGSTVLHLSLRDLYPEAILGCQNVVDDPDHACREGTSLHLAEQIAGDRRFIDASVGGVLAGSEVFRHDPDRIAVFSPFGLGILDLTLALFVKTAALRQGLGLRIDDFLPASTASRDTTITTTTSSSR